jgi:MFS family permease
LGYNIAMDRIFGKLKNIQALMLIFVSLLILSFHYFFVYFINSTYLSEYFSEKTVGYLFTVGALINIIVYIYAPKILRRYGNYKLTMALAFIELISLVGLAFITSPLAAAALFILHQAVGPTLFYCLDIFIERYAENKEMGSIRGTYLTLHNIPPILTPFITGLILSGSEYWKVYIIAAFFMIPFMILVLTNFRQFSDQKYEDRSIKSAALDFYKNKNIFDVFLDQFLLHMFYGFTVVYIPLYLVNHIGFAWSEVGIILSVMLLPFLLFQIPIGRMEDKYHDEKFILIVGFVIMSGSFMLIPFIQEASIVLWSALLFTSRIGASFVEVSSESYFFKHISPSNAGYISFFRMTRALPYLITPFIAGITMAFLDIKYVFFVAGALMLLGVRYTMQITR